MARSPACSPRLSIVEHYREMEALDRMMPSRYCYLRSALRAAVNLSSGSTDQAYQTNIININTELFMQARRAEALRMAKREARRK